MVRYLLITLAVAAALATTALVSVYAFGSERVVYTNDDDDGELTVVRDGQDEAERPTPDQQNSEQPRNTGGADTESDKNRASLTPPADSSPSTSTTSNTITGAFRSYVSLLSEQVQTDEDLSFDSATQQAAVRSFLEDNNVKEMVSEYERFTVDDLSLSKDVDQSFLQSYADRLQETLSPSDEREKLSAYPVYLKAKRASTDEERVEHIRTLRDVQDHYTDIRTRLLTMEVPADAAEHHIDLVNSISVLIARIEGMRKLQTDPVRGIIHGAAYKTQAQAFVGSYQKIKTYFEDNNTSFATQ